MLERKESHFACCRLSITILPARQRGAEGGNEDGSKPILSDLPRSLEENDITFKMTILQGRVGLGKKKVSGA